MSGGEKSVDSGGIRRARAQDEESGVPMCIYWDTAQVADWMVEIGYPQYRECIERNFVSGRHFIGLDASALPKLGIYDFEHIKDITAKVRKLIGLDNAIWNVNVAMRDPMVAYMVSKCCTGRRTAHTTYHWFVCKHKKWFR